MRGHHAPRQGALLAPWNLLLNCYIGFFLAPPLAARRGITCGDPLLHPPVARLCTPPKGLADPLELPAELLHNWRKIYADVYYGG